MRGPFYISAGGEFPSQSSQPVFITESEFYDCCCSTGCACTTVLEWDCSANAWVLVSFVKADFFDEFFFSGPPYDQWNYFFFKRYFPRSETIIAAEFCSWIDCSESCSMPTFPAPPPLIWREWKCDEEEPEIPPVNPGYCQKLAIYILDCDVPEWVLDEVQIVKAKNPAGTVIMQPDEVTFWVYGRVFDCENDDQPPDPGPPGEASKYCPEPEPAPTTCPCAGSWPPESWPCGGLLEEYSLTSFYVEYFLSGVATGDLFRVTGPITLSANAAFPCQWVDAGEFEFYDESIGEWVVQEDWYPVLLELRADGWYVFVDSSSNDYVGGGGFYKTTGLTPVGSYTIPVDPFILTPTSDSIQGYASIS